MDLAASIAHAGAVITNHEHLSTAGTWERRLNTYLHPELLIPDDFGLKSIQPPGPEDLYDVINERYEHGSILLTSNRAPSEWSDLFLDPLLASTGLDRLLDRAEVVIIRGPSFRAQGRKNIFEEMQIDAQTLKHFSEMSEFFRIRSKSGTSWPRIAGSVLPRIPGTFTGAN